MAGPLVDPHDRFLRWARGQAEDLAGLRIQPRPLEVDAFLGLDLEVAAMGLLELHRGDAHETGVDIHELRHLVPLFSFGPSEPGSTVAAGTGRRIGHAADEAPDSRPIPTARRS